MDELTNWASDVQMVYVATRQINLLRSLPTKEGKTKLTTMQLSYFFLRDVSLHVAQPEQLYCIINHLIQFS